MYNESFTLENVDQVGLPVWSIWLISHHCVSIFLYLAPKIWQIHINKNKNNENNTQHLKIWIDFPSWFDALEKLSLKNVVNHFTENIFQLRLNLHFWTFIKKVCCEWTSHKYVFSSLQISDFNKMLTCIIRTGSCLS